MIQVIQQTDEEKMAMYMKLPKKEIIKMLIECNKILESRPMIIDTSSITIGQPPPQYACICSKRYQSTATPICDGRCQY